MGGDPAVELERNLLNCLSFQFLNERLVVRFTEVENEPRPQDDRSKCRKSEVELSYKILFAGSRVVSAWTRRPKINPGKLQVFSDDPHH